MHCLLDCLTAAATECSIGPLLLSFFFFFALSKCSGHLLLVMLLLLLLLEEREKERLLLFKFTIHQLTLQWLLFVPVAALIHSFIYQFFNFSLLCKLLLLLSTSIFSSLWRSAGAF